MLARFPQWLPIPANLDHGVDIRTYLAGGQETQRSRYFLSWGAWRARAESQSTKKIHLTLHPMVALRTKLKITKLPDAKGTLIYVPHSLPDWDPKADFADSMDDYASLPNHFKPLVLCLQMRDIEKGLHKKLRHFGLPIVTAGDINSRWFADRFYSILQNFQYSSSTDTGSHSFLAEEMGVSFFLRGSQSVRDQERQYELSLWPQLGETMYRTRDCENLFSQFPPSRSIERDQMVDYCLGTAVSYSTHSKNLRRLFIREFFLNCPNMLIEGLLRLRNRFSFKAGIQNDL